MRDSRPKLTQEGESVSRSIIVSDGVVTLVPSYMLVPLPIRSDLGVFLLVWQRGRTASAVKALIELPSSCRRIQESDHISKVALNTRGARAVHNTGHLSAILGSITPVTRNVKI